MRLLLYTGSNSGDQSEVPATTGDIDRPFTSTRAEGSPSTHLEQVPHYRHGSAPVCSLMQRRVARPTSRTTRVHKIPVSTEDLQHARPVVATGRVRQGMPYPDSPVRRADRLVNTVDPVPSRLWQSPSP